MDKNDASAGTGNFSRHIRLEIKNRIALISIDNPPVNSLTTCLLKDFNLCLDYLAADSKIKVIVITGSGRHFASGADIKEMSQCKTALQAGAMSRFGQEVLMHIENSGKPVIAAINGFCLGGGLELAMSCHIRIASAKSIYGMPEISLGMIPAFGASYRLPKLVGMDRAIHMILSGEKILPEDAVSMGLITKVVAENDLIKETIELAEKLAEKSSVSMKLALRSITSVSELNRMDILEVESKNMEELYGSHDLKEGVFAYLEKRKPGFLDR